MKKITSISTLRKYNGGVGFVEVAGAMGLIYGAIEACSWAAKTGYGWGTAIGRKLFK